MTSALEPAHELGFQPTLDLLASWDGRDVLVTIHNQPTGKPTTHAKVVVRGRLGNLAASYDASGTTIIGGAFSVGSQQASAIYMRVTDLVRAHLASPGHLDIEFKNAFHIEIQPGP